MATKKGKWSIRTEGCALKRGVSIHDKDRVDNDWASIFPVNNYATKPWISIMREGYDLNNIIQYINFWLNKHKDINNKELFNSNI